ncbi:MAG TPA: prolipoprotein diacylglyceryl transferase family protein, partial [Dongiaceae bacterium]|nr:prolipoprotein diacylglyceryl transferase family protein [Dongiaceae bacterium]
YWAVLSFAALLGAFWFGTTNLYLSGIPGIGRSAFGAIFGGIAGVEIWKRIKGRSGSTGIVYIVPLSIGMILGRLGCQFSGLYDMTYGAPTSLPWAWNFGDGIGRHPSPLYESVAIFAFLTVFLIWFRRAPQAVAARGFYVFIAYYAAQRFLIEFTKPYGELVAGLDLFQIGATLLFGYALFMLSRRRGAYAARA